MVAVGSTALAQERIADRDNSVRVEYQYIRTGELDTSTGPVDVGKTDTHVLLLSGVYSFNDRWKIYGAIPYVQKRWYGPPTAIHDPNIDFEQFEPPDLRVVDDGSYHGGFQDIHVGVQYLAIDGPLSVSPFISYGVPVTNYPFYGAAAIGKQLREIPVGVALQFTPYFSDWFFQADIAYVFSEDVLEVDLDYWLTYLSASYYVTPRFVPRVFLTSRNAPNALSWPEDFPVYDSENGYEHDRTIKHNYINAGLAFDYIISDQYQISATYFTTIDPDNVVEIDYAFSFALTRSF